MADVINLPVEPNPNPPLGAQFIVLGGKKWPVEKCGPRQSRIIIPGAMKILRQLGPLFTMLSQIQTDEAKVEALLRIETGWFRTEDIDLLADVCYAAISRLNKHVTKDQFLDMDMEIQEMIVAISIILPLVGLSVTKKGEEPKGRPVGELETGSPSTGTT